MGDVICISNEPARRARAAVDCVYALVPGATPRRKELLASKILSMCFDERHGFMCDITEELIEPEMQSPYARAARCPLIVWWSRVVQAVRTFYGKRLAEVRGIGELTRRNNDDRG